MVAATTMRVVMLALGDIATFAAALATPSWGEVLILDVFAGDRVRRSKRGEVQA
jgi:hypothetical protein